jgi:hypothetical protein
VRELWPHEARDFTPWLLGNGDVLARALAIDLALDHIERRVGGFSLDVIGRDLTRGCVLVVENQLEATNHSHLGQLLTYAAGTGGASVVWIATRIRHEHGYALDWLNAHTDDEVRFYGIEVGAKRHGTQLRAQFRLAVAPDLAFRASVSFTPKATSFSPLPSSGSGDEFRAVFFTDLVAQLRQRHAEWPLAKRSTTARGDKIVRPIEEGQIWCTFLAASNQVRIDMYFDTKNVDVSRRIFDQMYAHRADVEVAAGQPLDWQRTVTQGRGCRVAAYASGTVEDVDRREEMLSWCVHQVEVIAEACQHYS